MKKLGNWIMACVLAIILGDTFILVTTLYWAAPGKAVARSLTAPELILDSAVSIRGEDGGGSGFEGRYQGRRAIVTAAHVVREAWLNGAKYQVIETAEGVTVTRALRVVMYSSRLDLAVCATDEETPTRTDYLDLTPAPVHRAGEDVWYAGCGAHCRAWMEKSVVSRARWKRTREGTSDNPYITGFLVTGRGFYGNSGSAVWAIRDGRPHLVGVICCWATENDRCFGNGPLACQGCDGITEALDLAVDKLPKLK